MDIVKNLPNELQNKVFYFAAEHPTATCLKRTWFCQFLCRRDLRPHQNTLFMTQKCDFCNQTICNNCCDSFVYRNKDEADFEGEVCLRCMVLKHEDICINEMMGWNCSPPWGSVRKELARLDDGRKLKRHPTFMDTISAPENREVLEDFIKSWMQRTIARNDKFNKEKLAYLASKTT